MAIDENNVLKVIQRLSFPRLVGTTNEKNATAIVIDEFSKINQETIHREKFKTSMHSWNIARWAFIPVGIYLITIAISLYFNSWITLLLTIFFFIIGVKCLRMLNPREISLSKREANNFETENVYVKLNSINSKAIVILIAHYDSKGQIFPKTLLISLYIITIFGYLIMGIFFLIFSMIKIFFVIPDLIALNILLSISIILTSIGALNYFNKTINSSPGATDDAAGIGALVEILRVYKNYPLQNIDLLFMATSSEELNLGGAKTFMKNHGREFDPMHSFFINLDSLGSDEPFRLITSYGMPKKKCSLKLKNLFFKSARELNISLKEIYLPAGAWSDCMPIVRAGFEACWLDCSKRLIKYTHTKNDTISLVSRRGLKKSITLCIDVINKLNEEFQ